MRTVAVSFTNFGPYHLARLHALATALERAGRAPDRLRNGGFARVVPVEDAARPLERLNG